MAIVEDQRNVPEILTGRNCNDFERWNLRKFDSNFVICV